MLLVLFPRRQRPPIATLCNLIRITMSSTSIHTNKFGVPFGFMTQQSSEHHLPFQRTPTHINFTSDRPLMAKGGRAEYGQYRLFIVVLRANKFYSKLLLLFCLFHRTPAHLTYLVSEKTKQHFGRWLSYFFFFALTRDENVPKVPRKNNWTAEIVRQHSLCVEEVLRMPTIICKS